jgi:N-acylneuraminate cytidylyltransferase/CMP-N,N'-diacetyllegionaminic acid synthase
MADEDLLVVACVCARGGSRGVPRKNLRQIQGKTLIARAVEQALACACFDRVVVSTDDEEIAEAARAAGAEVPFLRPVELARDDTSKWLVFRHLVRQIESGDGRRVGILADLDTGAMLRTNDDIERCVQRLARSDAEVCVTAYEADHNPYYNMVQEGVDGRARVCNPVSPAIVNRQQAPRVYCLSPATFAIRRDALWEREHWSGCRMELSVIPRERALDIDTELDFELVRLLMDRRLEAGVAAAEGPGAMAPLGA